MRPLSKLEQKVYDLDRAGKGPTQIAKELGISVSHAGQTKSRIEAKGYKVANMVPVRPSVTVEGFLSETNVPRSEHEPDDDEQPDADEPAHTDIKRCTECNLILPCYHQPYDVWQKQEPAYHGRVLDGNWSDEKPLQSTKLHRW